MTYIQMQSSYTKEAVNFGHEMEKKNIISSYFIKHIFENLSSKANYMYVYHDINGSRKYKIILET